MVKAIRKITQTVALLTSLLVAVIELREAVRSFRGRLRQVKEKQQMRQPQRYAEGT